MRDVGGYTIVNRVWWVLPMVVVLLFLVVLAVVGSATVPYTMYTLF